jgi:PhoPQ-activated pathogenicity-related protein
VKLWQATNDKARDFRLETIGAIWVGTELQDQGDGVYLGRVAKPEQGWTAYMVELTYVVKGSPAPFKFTTQVNVNPDVTMFKFSKPAKLVK